MEDTRVGVFVCHCGSNIGGFLDVPGLVEYARALPHVTFVQDNMYTCSDAGRAEIVKGIVEHGLNRVVVASCSPRTHEPLFRDTCEQAGLNPYLFEFVNIRDQCSWVHMEEYERATTKAGDLIRMGVARSLLLAPEEDIEVAVVPVALVVGAGVAGLSAALTLAGQGFQVKVVEREPVMGGLLRKVHTLYPTGEDARAFIEARIEAVERHPNIEVLTNAELADVRGFVGNYDVVVAQDSQEIAFTAGAIIVATGAKELVPEGMYGYDGTRIITQGEFEGVLRTRTESGTKNIGSVVMIQCVGSRDESRPYCSRICCMTAVKNALLTKRTCPDSQVYVLYRDMVTSGTVHEDLYREARGEGIVFIQYDPESSPTVNDGHVMVQDELLGQPVRVRADLVVLSTPLVGPQNAEHLAQMLKVPVDEHGFFLEAHVKLRPLDFATDGMYVCGCAHWPADIGESVAQAHGAAARAAALLRRGVVQVEPIVSEVDPEMCIGCGLCETVCPYNAIRLEDTGAGLKARTIPASCKGCGVCGASCPKMAIVLRHYSNEQIFAQIDALAEMDA